MPSTDALSARAPRHALISLASVALGVSALTGCGTTHSVHPNKIAIEPTIVGCSGNPQDCTSGNALMVRRARQARSHLCPQDKPNVLVKTDGALVCLATLPSARPLIDISPPSSVRAGGPAAVGEFTAGEAVVARTGCLACHQIAEAGNRGPGRALTHVGSRLSAKAIERALVASPAPMPSFSRLPRSQRRTLVYFLAQLH
jgi:Cytochrome c